LLEEFDALPRLRVVVGLGAVGFAAIRKVLRERGFALDSAARAFGHGAEVFTTDGRRTIAVIASYHPSRQNTNTGKLTVPMFDAIFNRANELLEYDCRAVFETGE
jgi:uracil-DNA glycosylase